MRIVSLLILFAAALLPGVTSADEGKNKADLAKLQGTWSLASLEVEGKKLGDEFVKNTTLTIDGDAFKMTAGVDLYGGTMKLDASKSPRQIDLTFTEGPDKGGKALGIYEVKGGTYRVCIAFVGRERPRKFSTETGSGSAFEVLKRAAEVPMLDGEWVMVSGEKDGMPVPADLIQAIRRVSKGNEETITFDKQLYVKGTYTVDRTKTPKTIDFKHTDGPEKGKVQLGIYELNGETLRVCMAPPGADRPAEFATKQGDGRTLTVWKRDKK